MMMFLQFLAANALSFRVVKRMLKGISYTVRSQPSPKGLFNLSQIREISRLCEVFESSLTYRAAFLLAFYGLLRISNIAPPCSKAFDKEKHFFETRCDICLSWHPFEIKVGKKSAST